MRPLLLTLTVTACLPATISAQPGVEPAPPTQAQMLTRSAHNAAMRGHCKSVDALALRVIELDATYYARVFARDPAIMACEEGVDQRRDPAPDAEAAARRSLGPRPARPAPPTLAFGPPSSIPAREPPPPPAPEAKVRKTMGHGGRAFGGALGGSLVGFGLGALCVMAVAAGTDSDDLGLALVTGSTCYGFGVSAVVMEAGKHPGGRGSFGAALGGAAVGTVAGYGLIFGVLDDKEESKGTIAAILVSYFGLPIAGSLIGYWATHRHDTDDGLTVGPTVVGPAQAPGLAVTGRF